MLLVVCYILPSQIFCNISMYIYILYIVGKLRFFIFVVVPPLNLDSPLVFIKLSSNVSFGKQRIKVSSLLPPELPINI